MNDEELKKEYINFLYRTLPSQHRDTIIDHLLNTNVGSWLVEASILFTHTKAFEMHSEIMKEMERGKI